MQKKCMVKIKSLKCNKMKLVKAAIANATSRQLFLGGLFLVRFVLRMRTQSNC